MAEDRGPVRVTIFGEDYQIRTELGKEYTLACARYVDEAIQEAHVRGHVSEPHRAAILAAMKITDELFQLREERDALDRRLRDRLGDLAGQVEAALDRMEGAAERP